MGLTVTFVTQNHISNDLVEVIHYGGIVVAFTAGVFILAEVLKETLI